MVEISSIEKTFESRKKKVKAVDGVSFKAQPGRIYGLLGPNGAGKTTTLRIIATLLKPDSGKAQVMGFDSVKDATQVRKRIGFLTSDMKLSGNLTPRELLQFFGELNHMQNGDIKKAIREMAEYLDMGNFWTNRSESSQAV